MAEKTLKTRIQLRNDSSANWEANKTVVLKSGEIGIETDTNKMKIGNGTTPYGELKYFGGEAALNFDVIPKGSETDVEAITRVVASAEIHAGDTAIVKRPIGDTAKVSYTAYVYDGTWKAMDGNYRADNVYFDEDLTYTANIGVMTVPASGSGTISASGKNVKDVLASILAKEKNPSATKPSVSMTNKGDGSYEIGTKVNFTYNTSFNAGSYTYGPATGITAQTWSVSCTGVDEKKTTATGTFENIVAEDNAKTITATATYNDGAIPKTNLGNAYVAAQIKAGSASATSKSVQGVRYMFWGPMTSDAEYNSVNIRALSKKQATGTGNLSTFGAGANAVKVVVAVPSNRKITKVIMPSALNADVTALFVKQSTQVDVEGANGYASAKYNVYVYQPASIDAGETYTVTIG